MKNIILLILATLLSNLNIFGQTRVISGRVITEYLEPLPMLDIQNSDAKILGKTDMDGRFKFSIPQETDSLLFRYIGLERTDIKLKHDCDTIEVIMFYSGSSHWSFNKIDRIRKKRFDELPNIHTIAVKEGLFTTNSNCYEREFKPDKPELKVISKYLKELRKANKNDFKELKIGDIVKIPFGVNSSEKSISSTYSLCENCTEEDYDYVITGKIINKYRRNFTLKIEITEMQQYDSLEYRGKTLKIGNDFKYEMRIFKVIIN